MAQSLLATDGYKFSMAEAGWPLRIETFSYSHRKGGPQVLPVDVPAFVRSLLPGPADDDYRYLAGRSTGRSEVRPRVQPRNPGAPDQAPEDPMIPDHDDPRKAGELFLEDPAPDRDTPR